MMEINVLALMAVGALCSIGVALLWWRTRELEQQIAATTRQVELFTEASINVGRTLNNYLAGTAPGLVDASNHDEERRHGIDLAPLRLGREFNHGDQLGRWPVLQLARRKLEAGVALGELESMLSLSRTERHLLSLLETRNPHEQVPSIAPAGQAARNGGALDTFE